MSLGLISEFKVIRKTDLGYIISENGLEYFLHKNDCNNKDFSENDVITAFLYKDKKNRIAATVKLPIITLNRFALCEVCEVFPTGVFINIGISKDLMLSKFDLPMDKNNWPRVNDKVACKMVNKDDKLFAKLVSKTYFDMIDDKPQLKEGSAIEGYVYRISPSGINLVDEDYNVFFVHKSNLKKSYRIGEKVDIKVIHVNEKDYNACLNADKNIEIDSDAEVILNYLQNHNGIMVFSSKSSPETIKRVFNMSKLSFKNALGRLYKQRKVLLYDEKTQLL